MPRANAIRLLLISRILFHVAGMYCFRQISYEVYRRCRNDLIRLSLPTQARLEWPN